MSAAPKLYETWYKTGLAAAIPWLAGGPNGQAEAATWPRLIDDIITNQVTQARYQSLPDKCASDALPHLGGDRQLIHGSNESDVSFRTRLKDVWGQWGRAGTACGVLEQLYYFGLSGAVWVQQNGLQYTLSGAPTPGQDPTALVVASNCPTTGGILTSTVAPYRQIPAGTPWTFFDGNTDLCNRFAIRVPSWPFAAVGVAFFNNTDNATVTWPFAFGSTVYSVIPGVPNAPVLLSVDGSGVQTTTTARILASGPWTGSVLCTGYAVGVNPMNTYSAASAGILQRLISTFRPNALCTGVYAINSGRVLGDGRHLGDGGVLGGSVTQILGSF